MKKPKSTIGILLAYDHVLIRSCLRDMLDKQEGLEVVGEAADGRKAVQLAFDLKPDVVVMYIAMPNMNGIEAARQITNGNKRIKVLALSMYQRQSHVLEMLKAGASGYLLTTCSPDELFLAVRTVANGKTYLMSEIAQIVVTDYRSDDNNHESVGLTHREREVLQLVAEGYSTKNIAANLYVSNKTVESHRQHLMRKLEMHSIAELTKYALREGITTLDA